MPSYYEYPSKQTIVPMLATYYVCLSTIVNFANLLSKWKFCRNYSNCIVSTQLSFYLRLLSYEAFLFSCILLRWINCFVCKHMQVLQKTLWRHRFVQCFYNKRSLLHVLSSLSHACKVLKRWTCVVNFLSWKLLQKLLKLI